MKHLSFVFALVVGCATTQTPPDHQSVSNASTPDIAQTSSSGGVPCSQEIARECTHGVDGCFKNLTTVHVCVAANAHAGAPCSQEIALECGAGEVDACTVSPAPAAHHICVQR